MDENKKQRESIRNVPRGIARVNHIIAIGSGKGGVGKSTVAVNLAAALAKSGTSVGLLDADIYGPSQPQMLGANNKQPGIKGDFLVPLERHGIKFMSLGSLMEKDAPVIWRAPIATKMIIQFLGNVLWGDLDYLLVDLPPGTGDVQITLAQQAHLTGAVIVTTPQQVALGVARKGLRMFEQVNVPIIGIIENMSGFRCGQCGHETAIFKTGGGKEMAEICDVDFLGAVPIDPLLMESAESGIPLLSEKSKNADSAAAVAFNDISGKFTASITELGKVTSLEPENISVSDEGKLEIVWPGGDTGRFDPHTLRISCPCAACVDEDSGQRTLDDKKVPLDIKIGAFDRVGRYAISISFSDGHDTGIFRYDILKELDRKLGDIEKKSFSV